MELQEMNKIPESAIVAAIGYRAIEGRMRFSAQPTAGIGLVETSRKVAGFSADPAESAAQRLRFLHTVRTDWKAGNLNKRSTTNAAIGGKKSKEEAGSNTLCPARDRRGHSCGLGSPYSKPGTAEDGLPHPQCGAAATGDKFSIASPPQQRNLTSGLVVDPASQT